MELRLIVEVRGKPARDVAVEVEPVQPVSDLVAALAAHLGLDGDRTRLGLFCRRTNSWLDDNREIGGAGLRTGDRVYLSDQAVPFVEQAQDGTRAALVDMLVVGGPDAGRRVPLAAGEHRVGSHRYASVLVEDPSLSRVHLVVAVSPWGAVALSDPGSEAGIFVEGRRIASPTPVEPGQVVVCGRSLLTFRRRGEASAGPAQAASQDRTGHVAFNRQPRIVVNRPDGAFSMPAPPTRDRAGRLPVASALVMMAMGGAMYFGMGRQPYMLFFLFLSPLMFVGTWVDSTVGGGFSHRRKARKYRDQLARLDVEMTAAQAAEAGYVQAESPDAVTLVDRARMVDVSLWERRHASSDWLLLRVGWSDRASTISLKLDGVRGEDKDEGGSELRREAMGLLDRHRWLPTAPMTISLVEAGVVGLSGDQDAVTATARWLSLQLAVLHSPQDLVLAAVVPEAERERWAWLGWLPHLNSEHAAIPGPLIAGSRASANNLIDRLLAVLGERRAAAGPSETGRFEPSIVLLIREGVPLPRGALSELLQQGPQAGIYAVWVGAHGHALPGECGAVLEVEPGSREPTLTLPGRGEASRGGGADGISLEIATDAALALAPVRDVSSRQERAGVPRRVQLLELLGVQDDPGRGILERWIRDRSSPADRDLSALLGVAAGEAPFEVSLRFDGPHALVGGMTGSGKSEFLQSLVAALAARYSPRTLNFLLVDYKGGAAFKDCVDLPHTVGFVTDLDGHLVDRALVSLRAELRRREEILRQAGAKDLVDLEHSDPDRAPPSLAIVVDEFAALAAELPQFVDGMVDVAQRGRSLGIHLVLATQRPAGVINNKIRANTNFRVSLRFSDEEESLDVVGTPDAASPGLPPGRAFARVGPGHVTEFQAGYVGGHTSGNRGPAPLVVRDVGFDGATAASSSERAVRGVGATDLQRLVAAAIEINGRLGLPAPIRPWLPSLPELFSLEMVPPHARSWSGSPRATIGLVDDPAGQRQVPLRFALDDDEGMLVFGSSGSGKTTALRSLAVSLALAATPEHLHVYALDFATRGLKPLEALPHCGAVIVGDETERTIRLLTMLRTEYELRKNLLASVGAATLREYLATRPARRLPHVLVLLDGYSSFVSKFEDIAMGAHLEALRALVAEGRPLGISCAISTDRQSGRVNALSGLIRRRLILRMAREEDYGSLGLRASVYVGAHLPPGRGFTEEGFEVQCAIVGADPSGTGQAAAVERVGKELREAGTPFVVPMVDVLPEEVSRTSIPRPEASLEAVVGLDDRALQPVRVSLADGHFFVAGPRKSGRTTALATFAVSLASAPQPPALHLLVARPKTTLASLECWSSIAVGPEACAECIRRLAEAVQVSGGQAASPTVLVVDDAEEFAQRGDDLESIAQRGRHHGVRILLGILNSAAQSAYSGWLVGVLRDRQGILLDPDASDGAIGGVRLPPRPGGPQPAGRGYLVRRGAVELVQVAR